MANAQNVPIPIKGMATGFGTLTFTVKVVDSTVPNPIIVTQVYTIVIYQPFEVDVAQVQGVASLNYPAPNGTPLTGPSLNVNYSWSFQPGMQLIVVDPATGAQEPITVLYVNETRQNTITAFFWNPPGYGVSSSLFLPGQPGAVPGNTVRGVPGSILGNPGPQNLFDHRQNTALVPHYSIIE